VQKSVISGKKSNAAKPLALESSPSPLSFMMQSRNYEIGLDELMATERRKVINSTQKTKKIIMHHYADDK
jgi:hypothetical protein